MSNEEKFEIGEVVIIDEGRSNMSAVKVVHQSPMKIFTRAKAEDGDEWTLMTSRLTKQQIKNHE